MDLPEPVSRSLQEPLPERPFKGEVGFKGDPNAQIAIVGEAPGQEENRQKLPFVGSSGKELDRMLDDSGIDPNSCYFTNFLKIRPPNNKLAAFAVKIKEARDAYKEFRPILASQFPQFDWPQTYAWPKMGQSGYLHPAFLAYLPRLKQELEAVQANVVVPVGNAGMMALLGLWGISKYRGTVAESTLLPGQKVIPTFHPAAILRQWENRVIVLKDFEKVKREAQFPEIVRPHREIWVDPTLEDIRYFKEHYINRSDLLSFDIETGMNQITCIGFAPDAHRALVIPFVDKRNENLSYWSSKEDEVAAWKEVKDILESNIPKLAQNGLYDISWLWWKMGIRTVNYTHDTMLLHHSLQPELPKGLGFLGSIYTDEASWKQLRPKNATSNKRDDE
jgi:DNA polymerase